MAQCVKCKKEFTAARWWQEYCSKECQQAFNREKYRREKYAAKVEEAEAELEAAAQGECYAKPGERTIKIDLVALGLVQPPVPIKRRV